MDKYLTVNGEFSVPLASAGMSENDSLLMNNRIKTLGCPKNGFELFNLILSFNKEGKKIAFLSDYNSDYSRKKAAKTGFARGGTNFRPGT